ncbi:MAG: fumarate hydratase [Candidatus Hodarchaeales archaeon]|jgi:fumarate hydratase subunit alpha
MDDVKLEETIVSLLRLAVTKLPLDVVKSLEAALNKERNITAKNQLEAILQNVRLAENHSIPICQDTGILIFYINVGAHFPLIHQIPKIINDSVRRATEEVPLRPNTVNPFTNENPGDNTGLSIPWINWKVNNGADLEITVFPKGGGSENMSRLAMLNPGQGIKGMKRFIIDAVVEAGAKPCPPTIIGIGLGGGADICMKIAKEQLFRPIGQRHPNRKIAEIEVELLDALNQTGIGPMGLGGDTTVLDVHLESTMRHPASFPVGLAIQCWAARRASATITKEGKTIITSHEVN